jgi:hypothetical protein
LLFSRGRGSAGYRVPTHAYTDARDCIGYTTAGSINFRANDCYADLDPANVRANSDGYTRANCAANAHRGSDFNAAAYCNITPTTDPDAN